MQALGEKGQGCQQIRRRYRQMLDTQVGELVGNLTPEQRSGLLWEKSPARGLALIVDAVAQLRDVPDAQWTQFRAQACPSLVKVAQTEPGTNVTVETVGALLDAARALSDEDFAAKRGELGQEWAEALMPNLMQQFGSEQHQTQQLTQTSRRLLSYSRGHMLVQAKLNALGEE